MRVPVLHILPNTWWYVFLITAMLVGRKWYPVFASSISLMTNEDGHLFLCLWASHMSSLDRYLFKSFAHLKIRLSYYCWVIRVFYTHSGYKSIIRYKICKGVLPFCALSFPFLGDVIHCTNVFSSDEVQFIFSFVACAFGVLREFCRIQGHEYLLLNFLLRVLQF